MARKKKQIKAKEPIKIRFKELANGNKSIYFDIYQNGKRRYEFLKLYLIPETDEASRTQNTNTLTAANAIKAQRIMDIANRKAGITDKSQFAKILLVDWLDEYQRRQDKKGKVTTMPIKCLKEIITGYNGEKTRLQDVDKDFCLGFIDYIRNKHVSGKRNKPLKAVTAHNYCVCLTCALNEAVRAEIIPNNPFDLIAKTDRIGVPESPRTYLTADEVQRLINTDCSHESVKKAFLFSCMCGLRISDVKALKWENITTDSEGKKRVEIVMQKTKDPIYLPLSDEALKWLPEQGTAPEQSCVFVLPSTAYINKILPDWAKAAEIAKHVSFHVARHTFATLMLTLGADLYTTSKLLGHKEVTTTQIYAKIIDEKKTAAANLTNGLFK